MSELSLKENDLTNGSLARRLEVVGPFRVDTLEGNGSSWEPWGPESMMHERKTLKVSRGCVLRI